MSPDPPAAGAQPAHAPTIWERSFPHIRLKKGFVYKSEFAGRDQSLEVGRLVELLSTHRFELGLEDPLNCEHQYNTGLMYWRACGGLAASLLRLLGRLPRLSGRLDCRPDLWADVWETCCPLVPACLTPLAPPASAPPPRRRATPAALKLIQLWHDYLKTTCCDWRTKDDQLPANVVFKNMSTHCPMWNGARGSGFYFAAQEKHRDVCGDDPMLNIVADGSGCLGILSVVQFANGFMFSTERAHEQHFLRPYTFHATYSNDKLMSLRQEGMFFDNPDHYWVPNGVLVYDPVLRTDMFHAGMDTTDAVEGFYTPQAHVVFVQHQLQQLRIALAVAKTLGRTLVLPRMACICQCFFFPGKNCNIDGHRVRLPHVCPTDHWLRPGRLKLPHREPGFLVRGRRRPFGLTPHLQRQGWLRPPSPTGAQPLEVIAHVSLPPLFF